IPSTFSTRGQSAVSAVRVVACCAFVAVTAETMSARNKAAAPARQRFIRCSGAFVVASWLLRRRPLDVVEHFAKLQLILGIERFLSALGCLERQARLPRKLVLLRPKWIMWHVSARMTGHFINDFEHPALIGRDIRGLDPVRCSDERLFQ